MNRSDLEKGAISQRLVVVSSEAEHRTSSSLLFAPPAPHSVYRHGISPQSCASLFARLCIDQLSMPYVSHRRREVVKGVGDHAAEEDFWSTSSTVLPRQRCCKSSAYSTLRSLVRLRLRAVATYHYEFARVLSLDFHRIKGSRRSI